MSKDFLARCKQVTNGKGEVNKYQKYDGIGEGH